MVSSILQESEALSFRVVHNDVPCGVYGETFGLADDHAQAFKSQRLYLPALPRVCAAASVTGEGVLPR